jgi:hypothetical protein
MAGVAAEAGTAEEAAEGLKPSTADLFAGLANVKSAPPGPDRTTLLRTGPSHARKVLPKVGFVS